MANNIIKQEREIGKKAAKMAQDYVHAVIRQKLKMRGQGDGKIKPLLQSTKITAKMGDYRLQGLNFTSSKIGFIHHYGFTGIRGATTVFYEASRFHVARASRTRHQVELPELGLFDNIYQKSGVLDYLMAALSETRTEALQIKINNLVLHLNSEGSGRS